MKTNLLPRIWLLLSLMTLVPGCTGAPAEPSQGNTESTPATGSGLTEDNSNAPPPPAATAPAGGIAVTVPPGWTSVTPSSVPAQYMKGTTTFIAKTEPIPDTDLDVIAAKATALFKKSFTNMTPVGEPVKVLVDGKEARKIVFTCQISGLNMKYIYVYLRVGAQTWAITFGGLVDNFDALSEDYQTILNQIRFQ